MKGDGDSSSDAYRDSPLKNHPSGHLMDGVVRWRPQHKPDADGLIRSKAAASGFTGVDFHESKWRARIKIGRGTRGQTKRHVIGRYSTLLEAARAYAEYISLPPDQQLVGGVPVQIAYRYIPPV